MGYKHKCHLQESTPTIVFDLDAEFGPLFEVWGSILKLLNVLLLLLLLALHRCVLREIMIYYNIGNLWYVMSHNNEATWRYPGTLPSFASTIHRIL